MVKYSVLKQGNHGLPSWDGLLGPVMVTAISKPRWDRRELIAAVVASIDLPDALLKKKLSDEHTGTIIDDRVSWAMSELTIAGLLNRPSRAVYEVTKLGEKLTAEHHIKLSTDIVREQFSYKTHIRELEQRRKSHSPVALDDDLTTNVDELEQIRSQIIDYNNRIATELLERIRGAEPVFFEHLVADLLTKMGYQGQDGSTIVTPPSNDGGIDGIINQDPLGTSTVYIQAKRYQASNIVQRPAIDTFFGALSRVHADRGVFITTSSFSKSAKETTKGFSIVLIDGVQLSDLMLRYHVGVQIRYHDELLKIDEDYFE